VAEGPGRLLTDWALVSRVGGLFRFSQNRRQVPGANRARSGGGGIQTSSSTPYRIGRTRAAMDILGVGTEITECLRIARMIERHGEQFLQRVFTPEEIHWCQMQGQWIQQFTARWAAKQAVLKALGLANRRGITWPEIEIHSDGSGQHRVSLSGALKEEAESLGVSQILVSLSYCRTYATAFAVALRTR
jgi:holo-[acyl-carrier protein] synthase